LPSEDATIDFFGVDTITRKVRAGRNSAAKVRGMGKIEGFQIKEREKVYLRCTRELEQKISEAKKDQVVQVLLKQ
jgi:hypothetical protein